VAGLALGLAGLAPLAAQESPLLWKLGLLRFAMALLIGAGLSIAGALLQGVLRNDLVETGLLGVNAGANLAATLAAVWLPALCVQVPLVVPAVAWLGALGAVSLVLALAAGPGGVVPTRLVLVGIAVGAALHALTIGAAAFSDFQGFLGVLARQIGGLSGAEGRQVLILGVLVAALAPPAWLLARRLNVLELGEERAASLGVHVGRTRLLALTVAAGLGGACVAVGGGIAFVGLLGPHVARRLVGPDYRRVLPVAAAVGAALVTTADLIGRTVLAPAELPAGLFVGVLGAPYLLYLLARA
jgi:iron complex transport system permease protein